MAISGPDDDTIRLKRAAFHPKPMSSFVVAPRPPLRRRALLAGGAALVVLLAAGVGVWVARGPAPLSLAPPPLAQPVPAQPEVASAPARALPVATEAAILADQPQQLTLFRFAPNPHILVWDFPDLREQGLMLNRVAAFAEKQGLPHDRVLTDPELARAIAAHGDTIETYYYGHDYSAATLRQFFSAADHDHVALDAQEERLRGLLTEQGLLAAGSTDAIITLPRLGADALVDLSFRRTILRHELSHGEYFTTPAYAAYAEHFWRDVMDAPARAAFAKFLVEQDYDPALDDLTINETQAYLMHTPDQRAFSAQALGMAPATLGRLQAAFLLGMPPGWLRDDTSVPPVDSAGPVLAVRPSGQP